MRRIMNLEKKYKDLVKKAQNEVMKKNPDLMDFCINITLLPSSLKEEQLLQKYLKENLPLLYAAKSIPEIFGLLNLYWDYLNYGLLQYIIETYGDDETEIAMESYSREVEVFQRETTLAMFCEASPKRKRLSTTHRKELTELIITHGQLTANSPLTFVQEFRRDLASEMTLREIAVVVSGVKLESVKTVWMIPAVGAIRMKNDMEGGKIDFFKRHRILELQMDGAIIYPSGNYG